MGSRRRQAVFNLGIDMVRSAMWVGEGTFLGEIDCSVDLNFDFGNGFIERSWLD